MKAELQKHTTRWGLCRWWWSEAAERGTSDAAESPLPRGLLSHMYHRLLQGRTLGPMRGDKRVCRGFWIETRMHVMRGQVFAG